MFVPPWQQFPPPLVAHVPIRLAGAFLAFYEPFLVSWNVWLLRRRQHFHRWAGWDLMVVHLLAAVRNLAPRHRQQTPRLLHWCCHQVERMIVWPVRQHDIPVTLLI